MTLRQRQSVFLKNVAKLILWAFENGYELTGGELMRTTDQQLLYYHGLRLERVKGEIKLLASHKLSKTMNSDHLSKLAIDLFLFKDGKYLTDKESHRPLHEYWKTLNENNYSGYEWGWDFNHFGMKEK